MFNVLSMFDRKESRQKEMNFVLTKKQIFIIFNVYKNIQQNSGRLLWIGNAKFCFHYNRDEMLRNVCHSHTLIIFFDHHHLLVCVE